MVLGGLIAALVQVAPAVAADDFWEGDNSAVWTTAANWKRATSSTDRYPIAGSGYYLRAIIGSDSSYRDEVLNAYDAPFGPPVISTAIANACGGLYLGLRERDFVIGGDPFVNDAPLPGTLIGALTIATGGSLACQTTAESSYGADGAIVIGADGRGFLTMTGGSLTGLSLTVGGEDLAIGGYGRSKVTLSGSASLTISNETASAGTATFDRDLQVEGPNVTLQSSGALRLNATNMYTAVITSATAHSPLRTSAAAYVGGGLNVVFSGAGASGHAYDQTWDLVDATTGMSSGNFSNLGPGGDVDVSGLAADPPEGAVYRTQKVTRVADSHKLLQLVYDRVLVMHVDRETGELTVTNPLGKPVSIDGYSVCSALGSMVDTYDGISDSPSPPDSGWVKYGLTANTLYEVKQTGSYNVTSIGSTGISLGDGFDRYAVAGDDANFGTNGEDLIFEYTSSDGSIVSGQVVYDGESFENNLVLRVNPDTGEATLKNDSELTLHFDGYAVTSSTGALSGTGWSGLHALDSDWAKSPASAGALSETNLLGEAVLEPGEELELGDISATGFTTEAAQEGLGMEFILSEGITMTYPAGDYNSNGSVDAADYTVWRDSLGQSITLANEDPDATTPGVVDEEDYTFWKANFGTEGGYLPETTFRVGAVVFDTTLGAGAGSLVGAVPEPGTGLLLLTGLASLLWVRRRSQCDTRPQPVKGAAIHGQLGVRNMRQCGLFLLVALAVGAVLFTAIPAQATSQGIALTNRDFELPGPLNYKTVAFDETGAPMDNIPGWTFPGPGVEDYGHTDHANGDPLGDSGTEGGGNPDNEMLLSMMDGVVYQTSSFSVVSIPTTQQYQLSFDAHSVYTMLAEGHPEYEEGETQCQLTARLYYLNGSTRTTIGAPLVIDNVDGFENYSLGFAGGSSELTPAIGYQIGVEFDCTSDLFNPTWVEHSWTGVDNVTLQITGVSDGDLDGDGDVDLTDYGIVRDHQQQSQLYNCLGELTNDGFVDLDDFRAFKALYAAAAGAGSGAGSLAGGAAVPEPSTLVLTLLFVAAAVWTKRWRFSMASSRLVIMAVIGLAIVAAPASAELFFYDPFLIGTNPAAGEYTAGTIAGQNPVAPYGTDPTYLTGPWVVNTADDAPHGEIKDDGGLSYMGIPGEGGGAGCVPDAETGVGTGAVGRYLDTPWDAETSGTFYISWLEKFGALGTGVTDMGFRTVEMWSSDGTVRVDDDAIGWVGYNAYYSSFSEPLASQQKNAATAKMTLSFGEPGELTHQIIEGGPANFNADSATHLVVLKFVLSTEEDMDSVSLYLDPVSLDEPDLPSASFADLDITLGAIGFSQFGSDGGVYNEIDDLRFADTWEDVVPPFPYPGDTDNDGDVDLVDYDNIVSHLGQQVGSTLEGDVAKADASQGSDGKVTLADFRLWKDNYPYPPSGAGALAGGTVPEPASWLLVAIAALMCGSLRRR
jgi:hypothetical protein